MLSEYIDFESCCNKHSLYRGFLSLSCGRFVRHPHGLRQFSSQGTARNYGVLLMRTPPSRSRSGRGMPDLAPASRLAETRRLSALAPTQSVRQEATVQTAVIDGETDDLCCFFRMPHRKHFTSIQSTQMRISHKPVFRRKHRNSWFSGASAP